MMKCAVCGNEVDQSKVKDTFYHLFDMKSNIGTVAFTDRMLLAIHGQICSANCYDKIKENQVKDAD